MKKRFPVTITTLEELRLLEQEARAKKLSERKPKVLIFDEFDSIRAHGMGVKLTVERLAAE